MSTSGRSTLAGTSITSTGSLVLPTVAKAGNYAMTATDTAVMVTTGAGAIAITLPPAPVPGRLCAVKKVDAGAGTVTVTPAAGTLDGAANQVLAAQNHGVLVQFDGANWFTVAEIAATIL